MNALISPVWPNHSLRIFLVALVLSILGHLFLGMPFISFGNNPEAPDDLIIRSELKTEPLKRIHIAKNRKRALHNSTLSSNMPNDPLASLSTQSGSMNNAGVSFKLPESGTLYYDSFVDGQKLQTGEIEWIADSNSYRLYVNIPHAFVGPFVFESRGTIDSYDIAPAIYWTQRGNRAPRYTRFDRDGSGGGKMFFSEKSEFTPSIVPGTQDRFSLMFQLAALLNGDGNIDDPGRIRAIPVVDYNTLDHWYFKSYGEAANEDIPSLGNSVNRHYALMQRENDPYKRQVDI